MSSTILPFLYQTRTLQRALRAPLAVASVRFTHPAHQRRTQKHDNSIPFEWDSDSQHEGIPDVPGQQSTITPSEAEVFKGIFDEIAQGKMPGAKKRLAASESTPQQDALEPGGDEGDFLAKSSEQHPMARSIVEQARVTDFRDNVLRRYPPSLRNAAQVALGLFELEPTTTGISQMMELDEADEKKWKERARYDRVRNEERERVDGLMKSCTTDSALWKVMQEEVFSLPEKLGIAQATPAAKAVKAVKAKGKRASNNIAKGSTSTRKNVEDEKQVMDVHGPLYSHFISAGLNLLDTSFKHSSPLAFQILPRIKELGLPSYVLGVSTSFYAKLAWIYWNRFGDANSALDVLHEMSSAGLYADEEVHDLLVKIRDHLHGCTWGAQGPFVMAMMESPPYDSALTQRLEEMEQYTLHSLNEQAQGAATT